MNRIQGQEGGRPKGIWDVLQGSNPGGVAFRLGGVGPYPPHGTGPGQFSAQVRVEEHREAAKEVG